MRVSAAEHRIALAQNDALKRALENALDALDIIGTESDVPYVQERAMARIVSRSCKAMVGPLVDLETDLVS